LVAQLVPVFFLMQHINQLYDRRLKVCLYLSSPTVFPLIEAGSLIEAEGLKANIIELIAHTPVALWCIASFVRIVRLAERRYGLPAISLCSNKYKTKNLGVLNNVMFIREPGGSNRSRVSNRSRGSDTIVLIEAGGFY